MLVVRLVGDDPGDRGHLAAPHILHEVEGSTTLSHIGPYRMWRIIWSAFIHAFSFA